MKINVTAPKSSYDSAVIIPCFNEEKRINIGQYMDSLGDFSSKVFLVDDGSRDKTFAVLKKLEKMAPDRFIAVKAPQNMGKAEAVRLGLNTALDKNFRHIGFLDADLAVKFSEIPNFLRVFQNVPEVNSVVGVRLNLAGHKLDRSAGKYFAQGIIARMANLLFSPKISDTQCGAKMFSADVLRPTTREPFISRWLFDMELLKRISDLPQSKGKNWLFEFPVTSWSEMGGSKRKFSDYAKCLKDFFKIVSKYGFK
ncbi:MAG: glycosyltransferase [bacterium]|nr:glycosyltransferase [bacterium]